MAKKAEKDKSSDGIQVFSRICKEAQCPSALMILSPDSLRRERAITKLIEHFKLQSAEKVYISIADSNPETLVELKYKAAELSLFSREKIIIFKDIQNTNADKTEVLLNLLLQIEGTRLFFIGTGLTSISRLYKHFDSKNLLIDLTQQSENDFLRWIEKEAITLKVQLDEKALRTLAALADGSADKAYRMLEQTSLYSENGVITAADLLTLFSAKTEADIFKLIDFLNARQLASAEIELHNMIKAGGSVFQLLGALHSYYFQVFLLAIGIKNGHSAEGLGKHLGIRPYFLSKYLSAARMTAPEKLKNKLAEILRTDSILKNRNLKEENTLSMLLARLAA